MLVPFKQNLKNMVKNNLVTSKPYNRKYFAERLKMSQFALCHLIILKLSAAVDYFDKK